MAALMGAEEACSMLVSRVADVVEGRTVGTSTRARAAATGATGTMGVLGSVAEGRAQWESFLGEATSSSRVLYLTVMMVQVRNCWNHM